MGTICEAFGEVGSGYYNDRKILCGGGVSGDYVWFRNGGSEPPAGEGPRGFPPPGGMADVRHGPRTSRV